MNWTWTSRLVARVGNAFKTELQQDIFHLDVVAKFVEVDACHVSLRLAIVDAD